MSARVWTRHPAGPEPDVAVAVASLGRLVLDFRLIVLLMAMLAPTFGEEVPGLTLAMLAAAFASFIPLMRWSRLAVWLMRHPLALFADVVLTVGILLFTGVDGPFLYYTLGTAFLAGVLYSWAGAAVFSIALILGYLFILGVRAPLGDQPQGFQAFIGLPSLYLLMGCGAAGIRGTLVRTFRAEAALAETRVLAASSAERARFAREMHDSLAKSLHGIALTASALPHWLADEPGRAAREARQLAAAAETAAAQARELIGDLRSDRLDTPLDAALRAFVDDWSAASGVSATKDLAAVDGVGTAARYELFCILKEALRNVERHAGAQTVSVALATANGSLALTVADDGRGLSAPVDLDRLTALGHYGVVGMTERAQRVGGRLEVRERDPHGVAVVAEVPADGGPAALDLCAREDEDS